ncbi:cytochrome o ubiquinol oxidase subunit IV [Oceanobacter kriegii]|uniref:cytochrome o ubiquinol oxidase subunit IV n=1 Tax=Oceanobacter kriegii TaxID=64972 RepID=UPI00040B2D8E|nr:cytochrome o ubiquinol oxidase subunit IV [Oceanobacter kriegii]
MSNHHDHHEEGHGSYSDYVIGFVLSVILTVIPFGLVMTGALEKSTTLITVVVFAIVQIAVHLKYFLHLSFKTEEGAINLMTFLFSALIIVLVVGLSIWIIYASNYMMMM